MSRGCLRMFDSVSCWVIVPPGKRCGGAAMMGGSQAMMDGRQMMMGGRQMMSAEDLATMPPDGLGWD